MEINEYTKNPVEIKDLEEVNEIIHRMDLIRNEHSYSEIGVLEIFNRSQGGRYKITTKNRADKYLRRRAKFEGGMASECGIDFYPHSYFVELRQRLQTEKPPKDSKSYVAK